MKTGSIWGWFFNGKRSFSVFALLVLSLPPVQAQEKSTGPAGGRAVFTGKAALSLTIDGAKKKQRFDGIGVNANTASWKENELKPAIEALAYTMKANIWRVVIESEKDWEEKNDNDDPFSFNRDYYNALYETPKFRKAWEMIAYLNKFGVTDNMMINIMGRVPSWMGFEIINPEREDEYVEMLVSMLLYARNERHLKFGLFGPMNEPDIKNEGPTVGGEQYARIMKKFVKRLDEVGLGDLRLVAPDAAGMGNVVKNYLPPMMEDPDIMAKVAHTGFHSYSGCYMDVDGAMKKTAYPDISYWVTEWNAWRDGLDNGQLGVYDYDYAAECARYLVQFLKNGASAAMVWEAYDTVYEHPPGTWSYWGILAYDQKTKVYTPRKHFYAISQVSRFIEPGSRQIGMTDTGKEVTMVAFRNDKTGTITITGENSGKRDVAISATLANLPSPGTLRAYYTTSTDNMRRGSDVAVKSNRCKVTIPAKSIFTLTNSYAAATAKPQPEGWFSGDIHVHRSCGEPSIAVTDFLDMMELNDLNVISLMADMGNGEVGIPAEDMAAVNGADHRLSKPGRIIHWDAEWHWDSTYTNFPKQALGGHLVFLGLKEARQIWDESPAPVLEWGRKQKALGGFCHMQYLRDVFPAELNCCLPVNYPVEAALGTIDFISEDVDGTDYAMNAYYRLLNCGFRPGFAAGTDYSCNYREPLGTLLTYVQLKDRKLTYRKWIEGIAKGNTVISKNGHNEFISIAVNGATGPGGEVRLKGKGKVSVDVRWSAIRNLAGRIELVKNGVVVAVQEGSASPGKPLGLAASVEFDRSGWLCARRMDGNGHQSHTAAVYVTVGNAPVRASAADARYFIDWIDRMIARTSPGGDWNRFFPTKLAFEQNRFRQARDVYRKILVECDRQK